MSGTFNTPCETAQCIGNIPVIYVNNDCKVKMGHQIIQSQMINQLIALLIEANLL